MGHVALREINHSLSTFIKMVKTIAVYVVCSSVYNSWLRDKEIAAPAARAHARDKRKTKYLIF